MSLSLLLRCYITSIRQQKALGEISFTADFWSDPNRRSFFAITAHWLARHPSGTGLDFRIALIAFHRVGKAHTGQVIASEAMALLDRVGVTSRVRSSVQFP